MTVALVTGGSGFVGANLVRRLIHDGHDVHLLVRPGWQQWRLEDVLDRVAVHEAAPGADLVPVADQIRAEWVFHLAAHGAYPDQRDVEQMIQTNLRVTIDLLHATARKGFKAFIYAGSSSEYGYKDHPASEDEVLEPNSDYAVTKAAGSLYCRNFAIHHRLNVKVLRLYSVYGPWEEPTRLIPTLISRALIGQLPPLANPNTARDFIFVDDVCDAFLAATTPDASGEIFNICTGVQTTLEGVVALVRELFALDVEPAWSTMAPRAWDTPSWVGNPDKIRRRLGWNARMSLRGGLLEMIQWHRERNVQQRPGPGDRIARLP